ncbi:hypothetical protein [Fluviicola taffensis]|uniref:hypothetical protein n=1 Tax=Fluviicola taffensis TaxID=191579 RepID=UPI0031377A33
MKETDNIWQSTRLEKLELENKIKFSSEFIHILKNLDKDEPKFVVWETTIDLSQPSFEEQINTIVLGTALKIQRRRKSFFGRLFFSILGFLSSFFSRSSSEPGSNRSIGEIRAIVNERRESFIRIYKRLSKAARGGRLIDIRKSTRRFKFLRIYSNNIDEEDLIANLNMKIYY